MKILIVINNLGVGGAERLVIDDIHEFMGRGIDVQLLTLKPEKEKTLSNELRLPKEKWTTIDFGSLLNLSSWFRVVSFIDKTKPDIMFTHLWYSNTIGKLASLFSSVKKLIVFEHNVYDTLKTRKMFLIDLLTQCIPDKIVAVSEAVKQSLQKYGIREKNIVVVRNGIDISKYKTLLQNPSDKNEKQIFTFIFIGRLIKQKGVDILLQAFAQVPEGRLLIVGTGSEEENLKTLSKELNLTERVEFLGTRHDIPELLSQADCFVLPSRYEGLPMVLLEAVAAEKLIITSDFTSATEVVANNENGIIVEKENIEALAIAMDRVAKDSKLRERLHQGISQISKSVSIQHHLDQLLLLC